MAATLEALRAAGILTALDVHFARTMGRLAGETSDEVLLAAAMTSHQVGNGHVCLDLPHLSASPVLYDDAGGVVAEHPWPALEPWQDLLRASPLVGDATATTPLVLDGRGRLYLRRYWEHETRLVQSLRERAWQADESLDGVWLKAALDRLFPAEGLDVDAEIDRQRLAATLSLQRRLCVISGGPGTGKTFTVVKLLALLIEYAFQRGPHPLRVTLVAPTGKAAARLSESIRAAKSDLPCSQQVRNAIPEDAATIHRCLGSINGSSTRFRHDARTPLLSDVVVVDEASMVDLALMARLLAAVPPAAHLILLGDEDQLASVEAGAVLGDICNSGAARSYSRQLVQQVEKLTGDRLHLAAEAPRQTGMWDCLVHLTRSYRYGPGSGIARLAAAINGGDVETAMAILDSKDLPDVQRFEPAAGDNLSEVLRATVVGGFRPYLEAADPCEALHRLGSFRVLCAHRRGPGGVESINRQIEAALADAGLIQPTSSLYAGRPVMVIRNDYLLELFNGDVGIITADADDARLAIFPGSQETLRRLAPSRLPPHETVFAMSVHKSQGSEFDEVAVVLPERVSPVLTRELLYTAVTRARRRVAIHGSREIIAHAIAQRIVRASGLRDALWGSESGSRPSP